ncbi:MAG: hypothetical protein KGI78_01225 [Patescibacteria group bacterium]|nr:hypothetical protein [Patescibacteria group bacterium]MDE1944934.1 hypothetical protein [Patescibacteria group bacterium]MDE2057455.1 hypothetical protein [Patescibacteria group bacterium]
MAYLQKPGARARESFSTRPSYGASRDVSRSQERFQATCSACHTPCEVPFRPNGKKPVFCRDCFKGQEERPSYGAREYRKESAHQNPDFAKRLDAIDAKLDRILKSLGN